MLDPVAAIGMRPLLEHALVGVEHHVDGHVAVGVNADLPVVAVGVLDALMDLLLRHRQDAVVGGADVRRAHAHRPFRRGPVGAVLHAADAHPFVAEAGIDTGVPQLLVGAAHHDVGAMSQLTAAIHVLVGPDPIGAGAGVVNRGQT